MINYTGGERVSIHVLCVICFGMNCCPTLHTSRRPATTPATTPIFYIMFSQCFNDMIFCATLEFRSHVNTHTSPHPYTSHVALPPRQYVYYISIPYSFFLSVSLLWSSAPPSNVDHTYIDTQPSPQCTLYTPSCRPCHHANIFYYVFSVFYCYDLLPHPRMSITRRYPIAPPLMSPCHLSNVFYSLSSLFSMWIVTFPLSVAYIKHVIFEQSLEKS